jgi:hypothetical protein
MVKPPAWHAVAIVCTQRSCEAAQALKGKRFLSAAAPRLPLAECTSAAECTCSYRKYPDRRAGARREEDESGLRRPAATQRERRAGRGRRSTDE